MIPDLPKLVLWFFNWYCKDSLRESILGDMEEQFEEDINLFGLAKAKRKFTWNVFRFFRPGIIKSLEETQRLNNYGMLKNYFKVGIRNILKYKMFSMINVFGLAVSMSVCMLIILMLVDQNSYDDFHVKKDRIYRIIGTPEIGGTPYATTPFPLDYTLENNYATIEKSTLVRSGVGGDVTFGSVTTEVRGFFADEEFLEMFSYPMTQGKPSLALIEPFSLVLSTEKAYELFNTQNPIGAFVQLDDRGLSIMDTDGDRAPVDWGTFKITGVVDMNHLKSHLKFDALMSASSLPTLYENHLISDLSKKWNAYWSSYNYVLVKDGVDQARLDVDLKFLSKLIYSESEEIPDYLFSSQKLSGITPGIIINNESTFRLPMMAYYVLSILALIIMLMACLNYTNLAIARSLTRLKEIGIRKVNGATRGNLIVQFLTEALITVFVSFGIATLILLLIKRGVKGLWVNQFLNFELELNSDAFLFFFTFFVFIGLAAGVYPAIFLAKKSPLLALKNLAGSNAKWSMQKMLNVTQFVVSLLFIVTSLVIHSQFKHYTVFEYGFNSDNIVNIRLQSNDYAKLKTAFDQVPGVQNVSACQYIPATGTTDVTSLIDPIDKEKSYELMHMRVSDQFIDNLDLKLLYGKGLPTDGEMDGTMVINESAVNELGYSHPQEALGQVYEVQSDEPRRIIGVVENFRATLLLNGDEVRPIAMTNEPKKFNYLNVKITSKNTAEILGRMEQVWQTLDPKHAFKYEYFDQELANTNLAIFDVVSACPRTRKSTFLIN